MYKKAMNRRLIRYLTSRHCWSEQHKNPIIYLPNGAVLQNHGELIEIFLTKLHFYGTQGTKVDWFRSYLTERKQKIEIK
jgi:hypothetical protein